MSLSRSSRAAASRQALPAVQARSRETLTRLLDAAEAMLEGEGLEAATVPAIAARAGVAVGSVYKRFPDKDALMRAVYERFFDRARTLNRAAFDPAVWQTVPAETMIRHVVGGVVRGYRAKRALLRALLLYAETHPDRAFRRRAETLRHETVNMFAALLAARHAAITHPEPERAIAFAVHVIGVTLQSSVLAGHRVPSDVARSEEEFGDELARLVIRYLGLGDGDRSSKRGARPPRAR